MDAMKSAALIRLKGEVTALASKKGGEARYLAGDWYVVVRGDTGDSAYQYFGTDACARGAGRRLIPPAGAFARTPTPRRCY